MTVRETVKELVAKVGGNNWPYPPPSEIEIVRSSERLGLLFPKDYIFFLEDFGFLDVYGLEVYGLGPEEARSDLISGATLQTLDARRRSATFPRQYLVIVNDDGDAYWTLDCSPTETNGSVQLVSAFENHDVFQQYPTLWEFIYAKLVECMEDDFPIGN